MKTPNAPERIYIDERASRNLPISPDEVPGAGNPVGFIREDLVQEQIRQAGRRPEELLIQIQAIGEILYGLSSEGRLYAHGDVGGAAGWHLITGHELKP